MIQARRQWRPAIAIQFRANREFIKLAMTLCCDIVANMRNRPLGASTCLRRYAPFAVTAENSDRTADATAVLAFAKPSAVQDFRRRRRCLRLINCRKNSERCIAPLASYSL